jgi:hypothetical protein
MLKPAPQPPYWGMATQADVRRIAMEFPNTIEAKVRFGFSVLVKGKPKGFAWVWLERVDRKRGRVPNPKMLAIRVPNLVLKGLMIESDPEKFFTEPHYNGYPAVLVRLAKVKISELQLLLAESRQCQVERKARKSRT